MKWRRVDNELARLCIQELQRNIHMGHIDPPKTTIVTPEQFDAWVLHFVHRTFEEEANNEWNNNEHPYDRSKELEEDLVYWKESQRVF